RPSSADARGFQAALKQQTPQAEKKSPAYAGLFHFERCRNFRLASDLAAAGREAHAEQAETEQAERRRFRHRAAAGLVAPRLEVRSAELEVTAIGADLHVQHAVTDQAGHDEVEVVPEERNHIAIDWLRRGPGIAVELEADRLLT